MGRWDHPSSLAAAEVGGCSLQLCNGFSDGGRDGASAVRTPTAAGLSGCVACLLPGHSAASESVIRRVLQPANERRQVFISYTRADREWVDWLQRMMKPLLRAGGQQIELWDDSQIEPGAKWRAAIETALAQAKVALLLVSDAFLASEFVMNEEVPKLLAAAEAGPEDDRRTHPRGAGGVDC